MAGMIALELNSVTRIHNQISFSDGEMPATHHNPEFCFSSYYDKPCIEFSCLGAMRCISNTVTTYSYVGHSTVHSGTWNSTNNALRLVCVTNVTCVYLNFYSKL